jgi:putative aldouronate transport system permease protein
MKIKKTKVDYIFDIVNITIMILLMIVTIYPVYFVFCAAFSTNVELTANPGFLPYPLGFTFGAFEMAFQHPLLLSSYKNTFIVLLSSLPINIVLTLCAGYFLSSKNVFFRLPVLAIIMFTMYFNAGLVPNYLNIQSLGLFNSLWALILPGAVSVYNVIICKTALEAVPESMAESAHMDGANDITVLVRIMVPLIKPTIAVLLLYYGVAHWNAWFNASIYLQNDNWKLPAQNILRAILIQNSQLGNAGAAGSEDKFNQYAETIKYAAIVIVTVPVLFVYPFLQKYFVKGVMIGAVKG